MSKRIVYVFAVYLSCTVGLFAQAFTNLNFEAAKLTPIPPGQGGDFVPMTNALPHWTGYWGTNVATEALQNNLSLGSASIGILGPHWSFGGIIEGQYTLLLQSGFLSGIGSYSTVDVAVAQIGLIPATAKSIHFDANAVNFSVSFDGQPISLTALSNAPNFTVYGGDISAFAGQVGELRISSALLPGQPYSGGGYFDAITFSTQTVPEPNTLLLVAVALTTGFAVRRRCR